MMVAWTGEMAMKVERVEKFEIVSMSSINKPGSGELQGRMSQRRLRPRSLAWNTSKGGVQRSLDAIP